MIGENFTSGSCMRFRLRWWAWLLFAVLLLIMGITVFRQELSRALLRRTLIFLGRALNGTVLCDEIKGDIFSQPRFIGVKIILNSDSVLIKELRFKYDLFALLKHRLEFQEVFLTEPRIYLGPRPRGSGQAQWRQKFPRLTIKRLQVQNGIFGLNGIPRLDSLGLFLRLYSTRAGLALFIDSTHCRLVQENLTIPKFAARVQINQESLTIQNLMASTPASWIKGNLTVAFDSGKVTAQVSELSLNLRELTSVKGKVGFNGFLKAQGKKRTATGELQADGFYWHQLALPGITGRLLLNDSLLTINLSGSDTALGKFLIQGQIALFNNRFTARANVESLVVNRLEPRLPQFYLSAEILLSGVLGSLTGILGKKEEPQPDSITLTVKGRATNIGVDRLFARVNYQNGRLQLRDLLLSGPVGNFNFVGLAQAGFIRARCEMTGFDLSVAGRFFGQNLAGRAQGSLEGAWNGANWKLSGLVRFEGFNGMGAAIANGILQVDLSGEKHFKDVSGRMAVGGEGVKLAGKDWDAAQFVWTGPEFDLRLEKESVRLTAQGDISLNREGIGCVVRKLEFITERETAAIADSCQIAWQDESLMVKGVKLYIADGELKLNLTARRGEPLELIGSVRGLNLSKFQQLLGSIIRTEHGRPGTELSGLVDFDVYGKDTLFLNFIGTNFVLPASNINLKYLTGKMALFQEGAFIREVKFVHQKDTSAISGQVQWSNQERLTLTGANLNLTLANPGAWIFAFTRPYVEIKEGSVYGMLNFNWQPGHLDFSGRARVSNGLLLVPSVAATVQGVQAELTLHKEKVVLEKLSGKSSKGTVTAEGFVKLNSGFELESLHYETRFFGVSAAPISGVYAIGGGVINILWAKGMERVLISGTTDITEALLTFGFGGNGSGGGSSEGVDYDIRIRGERGIWLRNRDADIELAADLTLRQMGKEAVYTGELLVRQGSIYYLDHILKVTKGRLVFDNVSQFNPQLDITAELPVAHGKKSAPEKIVLRLTGNLSQPSFTLSSEPPLWDETQILTYLSLNVTMEEISALEQKELLNRLLSERLLGYFQTQVTKRMREFISLDYLEIETGVLTGQGARVTVGKYVGRNLYVSYTQNFTGELQPGFLVEYYLNRRNELLAERSPDGRYGIRYRFKIRY